LCPGEPGARRVCLLTGAGGTLGAAFCRAFAADYDIVAVCRTRVPDVPSQDERYIDPLAPEADLAENRSPVFVVRADLETPGAVEHVVDLALARFGGVDLLVNNAAYWRYQPVGLTDVEHRAADFERYFAVNVGIPWRLAARLAERFWRDRDVENRARNRNVVNVSSLSATRVFAGQGQGVYAASKAALNQLTRHLAADFDRLGVRVNALAPNSFPALVGTDEVARAIARLDRDRVSGRILAVDAPAPAPAELR
jgi:NAD(P)-dependent dehydrogenase (short-subunit alcohol dehydrogenase family)